MGTHQHAMPMVDTDVEEGKEQIIVWISHLRPRHADYVEIEEADYCRPVEDGSRTNCASSCR
jgi:hypothetical protein